jgi:hypothetical protein
MVPQPHRARTTTTYHSLCLTSCLGALVVPSNLSPSLARALLASTLFVAGCSGRESTAARGIEKSGGTAVQGANGSVDLVEFSGPTTTDDTLTEVAQKMRDLPALKRIVLHDTSVTGRALQAFAGLSGVRLVDMQGSPVDDAGLAVIGTLAELTSLNLARTAITDGGLKGLAGLRKLRILDLSGTKVSDASVAVLAGLPELRSLNLKGTKVTPGGVARLKQAKVELSVAK